MELLEALLLGILQGVTEFLPVSSSGHLVLAQEFLNRNLDRGITFEIVVHFGSFFSILLYFRKRIADLLLNVFRFLAQPSQMKQHWVENRDARWAFYILLSMIPAGIIGLTLKDVFEEFFSSPGLVSVMLLVTGLILYSNKGIKSADKEVNPLRAFLMGLGQAFAMMPGISRAGTTITIGNLLGIKKDQVAEFSFLMLLPVIAGAMLLETVKLSESGGDGTSLSYLSIAFISSLVSGYVSLKYLIRIFKSKGLHYFAYYCWAVGLLGIIYFGFK
jgi:undecaprenyl-diphosphatase